MARVLLDTHALLWWLADDPKLTDAAREVIAEPANEVLVSAVSLWEAAIKRSTGKLDVPTVLPQVISEEGFTWLEMTAAHAWHVQTLPFHHRDPFDRLLIAQALLERSDVVTADPRFAAYGVSLRW